MPRSCGTTELAWHPASRDDHTLGKAVTIPVSYATVARPAPFHLCVVGPRRQRRHRDDFVTVAVQFGHCRSDVVRETFGINVAIRGARLDAPLFLASDVLEAAEEATHLFSGRYLHRLVFAERRPVRRNIDNFVDHG